MARQGNTKGARERAAVRRKQALDLRCGGASYRQIGEVLDVSRQQAHRDVTRALRNLAKLSEEDAKAMRTLEEYRLDKMLRGLWPSALRGHQGAIDRVLRIMQRRAMYLGLDAPKALDVRITEGEVNDAIEHELARLARAQEAATAPAAGADTDAAD